ncbi:MAG: hypothetical protein LUP94_02775, partial [Candidatus Methanomethylicus sp.]|nr:hypothetical protein [Candidatus Methanomethylicus sp.]
MSYRTNGISKNVFVLAIIVLAGVLIATGYYLASNRPDGGNSIIGSGRVITSNFNYSDFSEVEIWGGYTVNITHAPSFSVKVTTDDNIINAVYVNI